MGRTLIVGDVHGCAQELDRLLQAARPKRVVLVGDLFTRGPDPRGVWDLIEEWGAEAVLGNHDAKVLEQWTPGGRLPRRAHRWLRARPHLMVSRRLAISHAGVRPTGRLRDTPRAQAVGLCRLPRPGGQRWWDHYRGRRLVVFGHHAARGLLDQRPYSLGLDTGCVRGGRLTGYLVQEDRILSVASQTDWTQART